jgi:hypothetical protein
MMLHYWHSFSLFSFLSSWVSFDFYFIDFRSVRVSHSQGVGNWTDIAENLSTKTPQQIKDHWTQFYLMSPQVRSPLFIFISYIFSFLFVCEFSSLLVAADRLLQHCGHARPRQGAEFREVPRPVQAQAEEGSEEQRQEEANEDWGGVLTFSFSLLS